MLAAHGVVWRQEGEAVGELTEGAAEAVVLVVVFGFLDHVPAPHVGVAVVVVGLVGDEVDCLVLVLGTAGMRRWEE